MEGSGTGKLVAEALVIALELGAEPVPLGRGRQPVLQCMHLLAQQRRVAGHGPQLPRLVLQSAHPPLIAGAEHVCGGHGLLRALELVPQLGRVPLL